MGNINEKVVRNNYNNAKEIYASYGVDTDAIIEEFKSIPISVHNWQGDDVKGFEGLEGVHSENVVTGGFPGAARNGDEMRLDMETAMKYSPCRHKLNLHSMYAEPGQKKERNEYDTEDYQNWIDWAREKKIGMDFNCSYFTHPMMKDMCSLASPDEGIRRYWIQAGRMSRKIANDIGASLGEVCRNNTWAPDGTKDMPADRSAYRMRLKDSLDQIFEAEYDAGNMCDCLEGKVFSIGTECFTVGSHDFYLAYAVQNHLGITMDTGHYHPQENVADKISAIMPFVDNIMLHLSRGVRWDSDHCLIQGDELSYIMQEIKRQGLFHKNVGIGLDYFDATINRVTSWIIGLRAAGKALLGALLEPTGMLLKAEEEGELTRRLALTEEFKNLPVNSVWDYLCLRESAGVGIDWMDDMQIYEKEVQMKR
ncbi:L-rhamnose isomerase [Murimonas intestini]|uniref:L-rhamnose isomerase n=1 Tax=Murimonas intestini TaxID=1337051 RepID=UPI0011DCD7E5|nr:L-rhamnose isomerase [Murimonas intestini]